MWYRHAGGLRSDMRSAVHPAHSLGWCIGVTAVSDARQIEDKCVSCRDAMGEHVVNRPKCQSARQLICPELNNGGIL